MHKLSLKDEGTRTAVCSICGPTTLRRRGAKSNWRCATTIRQESKRYFHRKGWPDKRKYIQFKGEVCERCGFIPQYACQLDVDHIDGNHHNNDPSNLQTLCANCHRAKTWEQTREPGETLALPI